MATALVFGNSHTNPYMRGHRMAQAQGLIGCDVHGMVFQGERYEPQFQHTPDRGIQFHPAIAEDIKAAIEELKPICLITAVMGAGHWIYGMMQDARPFDFLVADLPQHPLSEGTELIPYDLLLQRFGGDLSWQFGIVRSVQTFSELPIFHIEAPPPVERVELMVRGAVEQHDGVKAGMEKYGLPTVSFRYKIWWVWNHLTQRICADLGVHFVAGPSETRDAGGFLDERFYLDGLHGTDEYGMLMAQEVAKAMRSGGMAGG